jgi:hypothetical protein
MNKRASAARPASHVGTSQRYGALLREGRLIGDVGHAAALFVAWVVRAMSLEGGDCAL